MNGTVLPPIIFTNCETVREDIEGDREGKVIYIPNLTQPSADLTSRWLDEVGDYLEDSPLVVHDSGPEYTAKAVQADFAGRDISTMRIPSAGGAFINPCDNPFNSQLKQSYFQQNMKSYGDKLRAILKAYYSPTEQTIRGYFEHVGWREKCPTRRYVQNLLSEGFRPGKKHQEIYDEMLRVYRGWKKNLRGIQREDRQREEGARRGHDWFVWE